MADSGYYYVEEKDSGRQYLTKSFTSLYSKKGRHWGDEEAFTKDLLESEPMQRALGVAVREASKKDLEDFGGDLAVFDALEQHRDADRVAATTKAEAELTILKYLYGTSDPEHFEGLLKDLGINHLRLRAWANNHRKDAEPSAEWIAMYAQLASKRQPKKDRRTPEQLEKAFWREKPGTLRK